MRPKGTTHELENRRRLAVQRVRDGYTATEVARFLGVRPRSVFRWLAAARDGGDRVGLNGKPHLGPQPRLDCDQQLYVLAWLLYPATSYGFATPTWTAPRLAQMIQQRFGVHYHPRYLNAWLHERNVRPLKPQRRARERNEEAIAAWLATDWPLWWQQARDDNGWVVFVDEAGLLLEPLWRRSQAPRGCPLVLECPAAQRRKASVLAALAWAPARGELRLCWWVLPNGYFKSSDVAEVLGGLLAELDGSVRVVWDQGQMHKGPAIRQVEAEAEGRLKTTFQPAYAPEVNPVERLWSLLKYGRLANFVPRGVWHLSARACAELEGISQDQRLLHGCYQGTSLPLPENMTLAA